MSDAQSVSESDGLGSDSVEAAKMRLIGAVAGFEFERFRPADRPEALHEIIVAMHNVCGALTHALAVRLPDKIIQQLSEPAKATAALSPFVSRLQRWPRGYPGDFETIEYLVQQQVKAPPQTVGYLIERYSLTSAIVQQHRNKILEQVQQIAHAVLCQRAEPTRILILAAGSSPDLALAAALLEKSDVEITLVDSDADAIAFSMNRLKALGGKLTFVAENVLKVATALPTSKPFHLVLAGGLFDYLPNKHATLLIRTIEQKCLLPGGILFFTNMTDPNPYRGWMRYIANWRVIERSPEDVLNLISAACGTALDVDIRVDGTGLALLIECFKPPR